jgi:hypothetical protein
MIRVPGTEPGSRKDAEEATMTTKPPTSPPAVRAARVTSAAQVAVVADVALQRVADASVWLIFRINGVRS